MKRRSWLIALGVVGMLAVLLVWRVHVMIEARIADACQEAVVAFFPSPDGAWEARINERTCLFGFGVGAVVAGVQLVSTGGPARSADLLGVDTGGNDDERPSLVWTAPDVLQVTVPARSFLKVLLRSFGGVRVDLRFDPSDPAVRAAWLRKLELMDKSLSRGK